ncbi:MAG: glycosyltransferase family 2 protein [Polyangiaceae bacterium]
MWFGQRVTVVIPCFREAALVGRTLRGIPPWVDHVCAVDDGSEDGTAEAVLGVADPRVELIRHEQNLGVGAAIATGYRHALARNADLLVVMAGDNQMDPTDLPALLAPLVHGDVDYAKGNRFRHAERLRMPAIRRLGGLVLSWATRRCTGLDVSDSQCGYTALRASAARELPLEELWPRFGYPNDLLGMLAARGYVISDVTVRPVYADERSGIRFWHLLVVLWVILRRYAIERWGVARLHSASTQHAE